MEDFKKCPCCGGDIKYYILGPKQIINCRRCGIRYEKLYGTKAEIMAEWNKRVS